MLFVKYFRTQLRWALYYKDKEIVRSVKLGKYLQLLYVCIEDPHLCLLTVNGNTEDGEILRAEFDLQGKYVQPPQVTYTDYQLIEICEDEFVCLLTENGNTKDDVRLPTDESLLTQDGFGEGKDLVVTVASFMGEEQICAIKDMVPSN